MDRAERDRILSQPFKIFPDLTEKGIPYGPRPHQKPYFINRFSFEQRLAKSTLSVHDMNRLHTHGMDILCSIGGSRSGKTYGAVACGADNIVSIPKCQGIVGGKTYQDIKDTTLDAYCKLFTVHKPWDHPLVESKPTEHNKILRLKNGSFIRFIQFADFERLRGREADFVHIDEASQLEDAKAYFELIRRLSGGRLDVRQLIITTNPPESSNWLHEIFDLVQFHPDFDEEERPIGKPCKCQYCPKCLKKLNKAIAWEEDSHPLYGPDNKPMTYGVCPSCGAKKTTRCIGNQHFLRVIQSDQSMNDTVPADLMETMKATMDAGTFALYGEGSLIELRQGKVFKSFSAMNVLHIDEPIEQYKPIIWSLDFNISYQCSVIIQTLQTAVGLVAKVVDEIVLPESGPEPVALEFVRRYKETHSSLFVKDPQPILVYGDHNGLNKTNDRNEKSKFQIIYDILLENGFNVEMMVKKEAGTKLLVPVTERVDATNAMLCSADLNRRLFLNKKCVYTKKSLEGTKWVDNGGDAVIDKKCDLNAARNPDKTAIHLLSHPGEALGYWIAKACPIINRVQGNEAFFHTPGEGIVKVTHKGVVQEDYEEEAPRQRTLMDDLNSLRGDYLLGDYFGMW